MIRLQLHCPYTNKLSDEKVEFPTIDECSKITRISKADIRKCIAGKVSYVVQKRANVRCYFSQCDELTVNQCENIPCYRCNMYAVIQFPAFKMCQYCDF